MILTDTKILKALSKGDITISPFKEENLGTNSYDITLGKDLAIYKYKIFDTDSVYLDNDLHKFEIPEEGFILQPDECYLGLTQEIIGSNKYVPIIEGRSSMARLFMQIHQTGGFGDIGFIGRWVLEITVKKPTRVKAGLKIGQVYFCKALGKVGVNYKEKKNAHYREQLSIIPKK